jgi:hypothetical protein
MPVICSNCGNTNHASGARTCAICGAGLPVAARPPVPAAARVGAPASAAPVLVTAAGRRYRLSGSGDTLIGSRGCAITLADPGVSPQHARIFPSGGGFAIEDLGGGTMVNGAPVTGPTALRPGDTVTVGATDLVYQGGAAPVQPPFPPVMPPTPQPRPPAPPPAPVVLSKRGVLVGGEVRTVDPERQDKPPFDTGRALVILSMVMVMLQLCAVAAAFSLAIWIVLLIVGLGSVGCLLPTMLPLVLSALSPLLSSLGGRQAVSILNFQVLDTLSGMPVDVMLIRKQGSGGNVRLGDKVQVWGRRQAGTGLIRAYRVEVYESGGHPANFGLEGEKPLPIWIGLLTLGLPILGFIIALTSLNTG